MFRVTSHYMFKGWNGADFASVEKASAFINEQFALYERLNNVSASRGELELPPHTLAYTLNNGDQELLAYSITKIRR